MNTPKHLRLVSEASDVSTPLYGFGPPVRVLKKISDTIDAAFRRADPPLRFAAPGLHTTPDGKMAYVPDMAKLGPRFGPNPIQPTPEVSAPAKREPAKREPGFYTFCYENGEVHALRYFDGFHWLHGVLPGYAFSYENVVRLATTAERFSSGSSAIVLDHANYLVVRNTWLDELLASPWVEGYLEYLAPIPPKPADKRVSAQVRQGEMRHFSDGSASVFNGTEWKEVQAPTIPKTITAVKPEATPLNILRGDSTGIYKYWAENSGGSEDPPQYWIRARDTFTAKGE